MKKLSFIPFFLGIGMGFYSCINGDVSYSYTYGPAPAIVDFDINMGGIIMGTPRGKVSAPSLFNNLPGDCLFVHEFTIDYDNQPTNDYYTATNIVKEDVNQYFLEESNFIDLRDYTLPISKVLLYESIFFHGKIFTEANCKDESPDFRLIYKNI